MPDDDTPDNMRLLDVGPDELMAGATEWVIAGNTPRSDALYEAWFAAIPATKETCPTEPEFFAALVRLVAMPLLRQHCDECRAIWSGRLALAAQRQAIFHRQKWAADQTALALAQPDPAVRDAMLEAMNVQAHLSAR